jgi:glycosyltransferase involved in cell wall biosynthesis
LILGTGKLEAKLKQLVAQLQLAHRVQFLGHVDHRRLPTYLQLSDVFVRPSRSEGLGSSFLEAMAAGLPVVATPVGGIPDFLHDGQTGLFCKLNDAVDLSQQIKRLLADQSLRERVITNGKNIVAQRYDWNMIASNIGELLRV